MKKLLVILLLPLAVFAAVPNVRVDDLGNVYQINADGSETNLGAPFDAMANHLAANPTLGAAIQTAANAALAKFKADTAAQVAAAQQASADAIAANAAELTAKTARVAELEGAATATANAHAQALAAKDAVIAEQQTRLDASAAYIAKLQKALRDAGQEVPAPDAE